MSYKSHAVKGLVGASFSLRPSTPKKYSFSCLPKPLSFLDSKMKETCKSLLPIYFNISVACLVVNEKILKLDNASTSLVIDSMHFFFEL